MHCGHQSQGVQKKWPIKNVHLAIINLATRHGIAYDFGRLSGAFRLDFEPRVVASAISCKARGLLSAITLDYRDADGELRAATYEAGASVKTMLLSVRAGTHTVAYISPSRSSKPQALMRVGNGKHLSLLVVHILASYSSASDQLPHSRICHPQPSASVSSHWFRH